MDPEILLYIPQRPPFIMIGKFVSTDGITTRTTFTIEEDNLFVANGCFSESGMIENMAQTAGAGVGYVTHHEGRTLQTGYIAALKNIRITALPCVGDTIHTEAVLGQTLLGFRFVQGKVMVNDQEIATCEFKIFVNTEKTA
jgi:predicted hotdog family 3-hydroxylacyl-ACP dehydratase